MRSIGIAQIVLLFLFVIVPFINYILARKERERKRRMESRMPTTQQPEPTLIRRSAAPKASLAPEPAYARPAAPTPAPSARPRGRWTKQTLFRSKRDLRRTIIAMTILGPCRADDPAD